MARAGAEVVVIKMVMGWRVASDLVFGMTIIRLLMVALIWLDSRIVGYTMVVNERLLDEVIFYVVVFSGMFPLIWLFAWQRVELDANAGVLRLANFYTAYRWRALGAGKVTKIVYLSAPRFDFMTLHLAEGMPTVEILKDSFFAFRRSRQMNVIAAFIRAHNPNAEIAGFHYPLS